MNGAIEQRSHKLNKSNQLKERNINVDSGECSILVLIKSFFSCVYTYTFTAYAMLLFTPSAYTYWCKIWRNGRKIKITCILLWIGHMEYFQKNFYKCFTAAKHSPQHSHPQKVLVEQAVQPTPLHIHTPPTLGRALQQVLSAQTKLANMGTGMATRSITHTGTGYGILVILPHTGTSPSHSCMSGKL